MDFRRWLEIDNEIEWRRLFDHGLKMYSRGPFENPKFHDNMVRMLRNVGLDEEANDLEMVRISDEDIQFGNTPMYGIGAMTMGAVLNHKEKREKEQRFRAAHRTYMAHLEHIMDLVDQKARVMGWDWDSPAS